IASSVLPLTVEGLFRSELKYAVEHEMVHGPEDFFNRRTGLVYFDIGQLRMRMPLALEFFREQYGWEFPASTGMEPLLGPVA
ncbi:MAG: glycerol-3-phosphate dehydrogenase C-terminal domain-containing protein, partial [Bacteroidota bacterium]